MPHLSPTVATWEVGLRLRERRELLGLTAEDAGKRVSAGQSYVSGVETGKVKISHDKLAELLAALDFDADETEELLALREIGGQRGWWNGYSALFTAEQLRFFGYEHGAESIRTYQGGLIPGLLQIEDYIRATINGGGRNIRLAELDRRTEFRLIRQRQLTGDDPVHLTTVINEAALRQQVGGREVLIEQLRHLLAMIEGHPDNLDVRVVPFTADGYDALGGSSFYILGFASPKLPALVWQETVTSTDLIDNRMKVREYDLAYNQAIEMALDRQDSVGLIEHIVKELT